MSLAARAMKMASSQGISLKTAWARVRGRRASPSRKRSSMAKHRRRGARVHNIPLAGIGAGLYAADRMGFVEAAQFAMKGDFASAMKAIQSKAGIQTAMEAAVPSIVVGIARKTVGPVRIFRFGKWSASLF